MKNLQSPEEVARQVCIKIGAHGAANHCGDCEGIVEAIRADRKAVRVEAMDIAKACPHVGEPSCYCGNRIAAAIGEMEI